MRPSAEAPFTLALLLVAAGWGAACAHALGAAQPLVWGGVVAATLTVIASRWGARESRRLDRGVLVGQLAMASVAALYTCAWPVDQWDAVAIHFAKVRATLSGQPLATTPFPQYPNLGPFLWSGPIALLGLDAEGLGRLLAGSCFFLLVAGLPTLCTPTQHRVSAVAVAVALVFFDFGAIFGGYQDWLLSSIAGLGATLLTRSLLESSACSSDVWRGLGFAASLGMVKIEGLALGFVIAAAWIATLLLGSPPGDRRRLARAAAAPLLLFALIALAWPVLLWTHGLKLRDAQASAFGSLPLLEPFLRLERLPQIADRLARHVYRRVDWIAAILLVSAAAARAAPRTRRPLAFLAAILTVQFAFVIWLFLMTEVDLGWHLRTAMPRLLDQLGFVWMVAAMLSVVALATLSSDRPDCPRSSRPGATGTS